MGVSQSVARADHINLLDLDSYKHLIQRLSNGANQCSKYVKMVKERAKIEVKYAGSLRGWADKWEKIIAKGPESGTVKDVWRCHVKEARDVARFHDNCSQKIHEEVIPHVKSWKYEHYHKTKLRVSFNEVNEAKQSFRTAQKPWKRKLKKVNKFKRSYHKACKAYDRQKQGTTRNVTVISAGNDPNFDSRSIDDDDGVTKRKNKLTKAESDYKKYLRELLMPRCKDKYRDDMYVEFRKCQEVEGSRIRNLQGTILKYREAVDLTMNQRYTYNISLSTV